MNYTSKIIFLFAAMSVSTSFAQTSVTQGGTSTSVNPWVSGEQKAAPKQINFSGKGKKAEGATNNIWLSSTKKNGQPTLQSKSTPQVASNPISNPWMKPSELKTSAVPENKK